MKVLITVMTDSDLLCRVCGRSDFPSRNQLFRHLKKGCVLDRDTVSQQTLLFSDFIQQNSAFIYVTGGRVRGRTLKSCERYDCQRNEWESVPFLIENRGSHCSFTSWPSLFVCGGGGLSSNLCTVERLNCITGEIRFVKPMSTFRHAMSVVCDEQREFAYVVGGWMFGKSFCREVELYNMANGIWTTAKGLMPTGRRLFGAALCEKKKEIVCFGGKCEDGVWDTNAVDIYSIEDDSWKSGPPLPIPGQTSAVSIGDIIYVVVHGHGPILRFNPLKDDEDKSREHFVAVASSLLFDKWFCFEVVAINDELYFVGGNIDGKWSNKLVKYNPCLNEWTELASMRQERRRCSAAVAVVPKAL
jgi:hypothetical protein